MTEQRMTLVERLRNPAWDHSIVWTRSPVVAGSKRDVRASRVGTDIVRLNVEQTLETMEEAANVIADLLAALREVEDYCDDHADAEYHARHAAARLLVLARAAIARAKGETFTTGQARQGVAP